MNPYILPFYVQNVRQLEKVTSHLEFVFEESSLLIRKKQYKRAYILLDKFYIIHNIQNQLAIIDRIALTKKIRFILNHILKRYLVKKSNLDNYDKKKADQIIYRLQQLTYEEYINIASYMYSNQIGEYQKEEIHTIIQFLSQQQQVKPLEVFIPHSYLVTFKQSIDLEKTIASYYTQTLEFFRFASLWYKQRNKPRTGFEFAVQGHLIATKFEQSTKAIEQYSDFVFQYIQSLLLFAAFNYEIDRIDQTDVILATTENLLSNLIGYQIKRNQEVNVLTDKMKYETRKAVKSLIVLLLHQNIYWMNFHRYESIYQNYILAEWLANNCILQHPDELKQYFLHICTFSKNKIASVLIFYQELNKLINTYFQDTAFFINKKKQKAEENEEKIQAKKYLLSHFNSTIYDKFKMDEVNRQKYLLLHPKFQEQKLLTNSKSLKIIKKESQFLGSDLTSFDQTSAIDTKRSSRLSASIPPQNAFFQNNQDLPKAKVIQKAAKQSERQLKIVTTNKYFQPFYQKQKNQSENPEAVKQFSQPQIQGSFNIEKNEQLEEIANFDIPKPKQKKADLGLDKALQKIIFSTLIQKDQPKNKQLVNKEFKDFLADEDFDKKEFDYCRKMLIFHRNASLLYEKEVDTMPPSSVRLQIKKDAELATEIQDQKLRLKKMRSDYHFEEEDQSDKSSLLSFEEPGVKLTPSNKWRKIMFKHRSLFHLANLRIYLKQRRKQRKRLQIKEAIDNIMKDQRRPEEIERKRNTSQLRSKELLVGVLKEYEEDKIKSVSAYDEAQHLKKLKRLQSAGRLKPPEKQFEFTTQHTELYKSTDCLTLNLKQPEFLSFHELVQFELKKRRWQEKNKG